MDSPRNIALQTDREIMTRIFGDSGSWPSMDKLTEDPATIATQTIPYIQDNELSTCVKYIITSAVDSFGACG